MEAYVWASTDADLGVCISSRVFGSAREAVDDAQEAIGDACPVEWRAPSGVVLVDADVLEQAAADEGLLGDYEDTNGCEQHVAVSLVKVRL